ncbi:MULTISPECIES: DUF1648 domain-containing protein [unclassified Streptomyces]|uniref:DUF1648 domain-containing protein n=1 Tax=Streptomyces thermocoprophilus TaxID=78356 RepID=A0ABV5VMC8_9ACTN|nr:DUF1648 domain-containing protein [Streptomyces sp. XM83C]
MNDRRGDGRTMRLGGAAWAVGIGALIAALPWTASGRLPDRLATHWQLGDSTPDGSMPLWAASFFPALIWLLLATVVLLTLRRGTGASPLRGGAWPATSLLSGGVLLAGIQASVVRTNLDLADWREAQQPTPWIVGSLVVAVAAGLVGWLVDRRRTAAPAPRASEDAPALRIPEGNRVVWVERTTNPVLQALAAVTGLAALAVTVGCIGGLVEPAEFWPVFAPLAIASLALAGCASVRAGVTERGLEVAFGPLGWPVRRWTVADIESARAEHRTPAQVGGWGYRLSGLGTTVMVRGGQCLVVRVRGRNKEFAVSVDDAERGAALLNTLRTPHTH